LEEKLKNSEEEVKKHKDEYLRTLAEFDNFRKRMEREKDEMIKFSNERLLKEFLPVLDHLEMTVDHAAKTSGTHEAKDSIEEGVRLTVKQFLGLLEKFGVKEIGGEGEPFNPNLQEAIGSVESGKYAQGFVASVHRKGFTLNGRLIRPAMVSIVKVPEEKSSGEEEKTVH
jgi:molecular chaperone GrpE